ncbi:hypothetical protein ElyMa_003551800 [Elysia marginata]|uniref:Uncharacterized protein n=1 Tax=Elysia marginata TaxID=1093978 RepID=A0AAV4EKA5_9GAST|nr:hypothetical protein ElyMa_003551800 [Elysia marginata]
MLILIIYQKLYVDNGKDMAKQKALLGLNDATTLTAYIQRQRDMGKTDLVYLNVGVLEAGETFAKIAWEEFKASLVHEVKHQKKMRYQPLHRAELKLQYSVEHLQHKQCSDSKSGSKSSKIISALQSIHRDGDEVRRQSIAKLSSIGRWMRTRPPPSVTFQRKKSITLEDMRSGSKKELVISRRQPTRFHHRRKISKEERHGACH